MRVQVNIDKHDITCEHWTEHNVIINKLKVYISRNTHGTKDNILVAWHHICTEHSATP